MLVVMMCLREPFGEFLCARAMPWSARFMLSVPLEVKIISAGSQQSVRATIARAFSSASLLRSPGVCMLDGFA